MKIVTLIVVIGLFMISAPVKAAEDCNAINVNVNGLVCDFCARALEKVFGEREEVAGIDVDLGNALVVVNTKPDMTLDDETLTELITDSGYNVSNIDRSCQG